MSTVAPTQLEALRAALQLSEGFELHFALVSSQAAEDALALQLRGLAAELELAWVELQASDASEGEGRAPVEALLETTRATRMTVLRTARASREDVRALDRCFLQINPRRDAIARRHRGPLVVVCRPDGLRHVVDLAPDFYSVHSGLFVIATPGPPRPEPAWMLFDHEAIGLLELDPSFCVFDGRAIPEFRVQPLPAKTAPASAVTTGEARALAELSADLRAALLEESVRTQVFGPAGVAPAGQVAELLRALPAQDRELVWLDGAAAPTGTLLIDLVRAIETEAGARPPVDARDLERRYRELTASRATLIVIDGARPASPFPTPSRPSKVIEILRSEAAQPSGPGLWPLIQAVLDPTLANARHEAAARWAREASLTEVEAAAGMCAPLDGARLFAELARLQGSPREVGAYLARAVERALCVRAELGLFDPWLRELEGIGEYVTQAAVLRFVAALRFDNDRAAALFRWERVASIDATRLAMVRRVILRDPDPVELAGLDNPRVALVAALRQLAGLASLDGLLAAAEAVRASWPEGAEILANLSAAARCWTALSRARWEPARLALEASERSAAAWGDPYALLRARLLRLDYERARGDLERAAGTLDELRARADELLGPLHPATMELLAVGVELLAGTAQREAADALADEGWRRLEHFNFHVNHSSRPALQILLAWYQERGHVDRAARIRERWGRPPDDAMAMSTKQMGLDFDGLSQLLAGHLYSEKKVFIRELIQNAHDSIQRRAAEDPSFSREQGQIDILTDLTADPARIIFRDNGLGMSEADLDEFLSTIGRSGTKSARARAPEVIGQFGIGFLSAFVVGGCVEVRTRHWQGAATDAKLWKNEGNQDYTVEPCERDAAGTEVTVYLRSAEDRGLLHDDAVKSVVRQYADMLRVPIRLNDPNHQSLPINSMVMPWERSGSSADELRLESIVYLEKRVPDSVLEVIPVRIDEAGMQAEGLLYITRTRVVVRDAPRTVRVFLHRMFLCEEAKELLPPWATFVNGVINTSSLTPNAARDNFTRDAGFEGLRERLGEIIVAHFEHLRERKPERLSQILAYHDLAIKAACYYYTPFFDKFGHLLEWRINARSPAAGASGRPGGRRVVVAGLPTNQSWATLPDIVEALPAPAEGGPKRLACFSSSSSANQFFEMADASGSTVVDASFPFEDQLLRRWVEGASPALKLVRVDREDDPEVFR